MEYKQCIYVRQSISGSTSASRTVHSGSTPKKLKENEGWDRNNKETAKAPVLTDFTQTKVWKSIYQLIPDGITIGPMKP